MRTHKVLYEVILLSGQSMKVSQQMTSLELSELLLRPDVRLICVNCGDDKFKKPHRPRKKKSCEPVRRTKKQNEEYQERKEQRLKMVEERKKLKMLSGG